VAGELARSNELNDRHLGGRQRSNTDDDDDPTSRMDENMEEIMSRFNIVNNLMSKSNDDDDDDEKPEEEPENEDSPANDENAVRPSEQPVEEEEIHVEGSQKASTYEYKRVEVTLPEYQPLERQMSDSCYWKVNHLDVNVDDLLLDYE
jgi:hypothetical protein